MSKAKTQIPLCHSDFLQGVTIALGRRSLKGLRYLKSTLKFGVSNDEVNGVTYERLDIEARDLSDMTKITIWENGIAWVYSADHRSSGSQRHKFEIYANLVEISEEDIAELIRATLRDLKSVQHIWQKNGRT